MKLIIVDKNISYSKSLKKIIETEIDFGDIQLMREIEDVIKERITSKEVILFDVDSQNLKEVKRILQNYNNDNMFFIALTKETESKLLMDAVLAGVSSIIYKTQKVENIVAELKIILRGKGVFPQKIINRIKKSLSTNSEK